MTARTRIQQELQSLEPGGGGLSRRPKRYGTRGATHAEIVGNKHDSVRWLGEQGCRGPSSLHEDGDITENTKDGYFIWIGDYEARKSTPKNHEVDFLPISMRSTETLAERLAERSKKLAFWSLRMRKIFGTFGQKDGRLNVGDERFYYRSQASFFTPVE